ncbi:ankyrin repeat-containing domain protein [Pyronema domesticum]|nr:ankyrin repeat-containing domain protein [Pyronema domesticum]
MAHHLLLAAGRGDAELVKSLLSKADIVNSKNVRGDSALHITIQNDNIPMAKLLLGKGAHINQLNQDNKTPLHLAVEKKAYRMVRALIASGADVKTKHGHENTVEYYAENDVDMKLVLENRMLELGPDKLPGSKKPSLPTGEASKKACESFCVTTVDFFSDDGKERHAIDQSTSIYDFLYCENQPKPGPFWTPRME